MHQLSMDPRNAQERYIQTLLGVVEDSMVAAKQQLASLDAAVANLKKALAGQPTPSKPHSGDPCYTKQQPATHLLGSDTNHVQLDTAPYMVVAHISTGAFYDQYVQLAVVNIGVVAAVALGKQTMVSTLARIWRQPRPRGAILHLQQWPVEQPELSSLIIGAQPNNMMTSPQHDSVAIHSLVVPGTPKYVMVEASNAELIKLLEDDAGLSAKTRKAYVSALKRLYLGGTGRNGSDAYPPLLPKASLVWLLKHPEEACAMIKAALAGRGTHSAHGIKNYIDPLMSIIKRHPLLSQVTDLRARWKATGEACSAQLVQSARQNKPSVRQAEGYVAYPEICARFRAMLAKEPGNRDTLLLALLSLAAESRCQLLPQRADYGNVRIYTAPAEPQPGQDNYVVLQRTAQGLTGELVLNTYKTAKTYGCQRVNMPVQLLQTLQANLERDPRSFLFTKPDGDPYTNAAYSHWANTRLKNIFGKPLTLSGVRHSFVTSLHCSPAWQQLSDAEREAVANRMGHSFATACRYRFAGRHLQHV